MKKAFYAALHVFFMRAAMWAIRRYVACCPCDSCRAFGVLMGLKGWSRPPVFSVHERRAN